MQTCCYTTFRYNIVDISVIYISTLKKAFFTVKSSGVTQKEFSLHFLYLPVSQHLIGYFPGLPSHTAQH